LTGKWNRVQMEMVNSDELVRIQTMGDQ
jgi:hypothetical protein